MVIPGQVCFGPAESWRMISDEFLGLKQFSPYSAKKVHPQSPPWDITVFMQVYPITLEAVKILVLVFMRQSDRIATAAKDGRQRTSVGLCAK